MFTEPGSPPRMIPVVGIDGRFTLVDGTSVTQPRYATWIRGPGFSLETTVSILISRSR